MTVLETVYPGMRKGAGTGRGGGMGNLWVITSVALTTSSLQKQKPLLMLCKLRAKSGTGTEVGDFLCVWLDGTMHPASIVPVS